MTPAQHTQLIKEKAQRLGFSYCGIAKAMPLDEDARRLEKWLHQGMHGSMRYMENHFDLRVDPTKLVPGARSVITLLANYFPAEQQQVDAPKIASYAFGKDYHGVIKKKLHQLLFELQETIGAITGRGFVDSAPVLERTWAQRSGLGWVGKNGNLITKKNGSYFFIATLITDLSLEYDDPFAKDFCGSCTRCIDACPTDAILPDKTIAAQQCISYYTIELKDQLLPHEAREKMDGWMFGCDACQRVCPWNRFSTPHQEPEFTPLKEVLDLSTREWKMMTEENFKKTFRDSPLMRPGFKGIMRNLQFVAPSD
ncbi:tRNA epoxyqueuosine(34) reductase QueG [bacterium]|nr:tRNA epoxyqueuosine(34) reductase QueG [bacterium]